MVLGLASALHSIVEHQGEKARGSWSVGFWFVTGGDPAIFTVCPTVLRRRKTGDGHGGNGDL